ncbi:MAG: ABC transporter permease [Bacteroidales bacterium]|nr:ABC transporter permease [Bacteroidales bacterium]MDT8373835.1 FtsX-like permease family protein [Bacteroidales bacterium]
MKFSLYIAKRYLFAKKSRNAINVISAISVAGVAVGTMALITILSVFNGLEEMVKSIFSTSDPEMRITPVRGKVFTPDTLLLTKLASIDGVEVFAETVEENALLRYDEQQYIATIKGVSLNYTAVTDLDTAMWDGEFILRAENGRPYAVAGLGVANYLGMRLNFVSPLAIYIPDRKGRLSATPENEFARKYIFLSGIFAVEQEFDSKYLFLPIDFARELLDYTNEVSSIEVKMKPGADEKKTQEAIRELMGDDFLVQNRYEQQEMFYRVMKAERLAIFVILTFILIIASFNIIGSLTMLIIEKERDISILRSLGADNRLIKRIFIYEGWMISLFGTVVGLLAGFLLCAAQQHFGIVKLAGDSLLIDTYPVKMHLADFFTVAATVLAIGYAAAWYPVHYLSRRYLRETNKYKQ